MNPRVFAIPLIIAVFSVIVIGLALNLDKSPPMIVGDSMQPRAFPIFLMILNLILTAVLLLQNLRSPPAAVALEPLPTWGSIALMLLFYILGWRHFKPTFESTFKAALVAVPQGVSDILSSAAFI